MSLPPRLPGESLIDYRKRVESDPSRWGTSPKTDTQAQQRAAQDSLRKMFTTQGVMGEPQKLAVASALASSAASARSKKPVGVVTAAFRYAIVGTLLLFLVALLLWQLGSH